MVQDPTGTDRRCSVASCTTMPHTISHPGPAAPSMAPGSYIGTKNVGFGNETVSREYDQRTFLAKYGELFPGKYSLKSKQLDKFLDGEKTATVRFTSNGQIILSGIGVNYPDMAAYHKDEYEKRLKEIQDGSCNVKESISRYSWITTFAIWAIIILVVIIFLVYGFRWFFTPSPGFD